jgi:Leucine-rich repeat (LRR) protein
MIVPSLVLPKDVVYLESTCLGGGYGRFNNLEQLIVDNATPEEIVMLPKLKTLSFVSSARRMRAKNQHYNDAVLLPNLTKLCLQDCQINQTIVEEIFKLENIKELDITRTHFTLQLGPQVIIPKSLRALALEECCSNTPGAMSHNIKNLTIDTCRDHSGLCCLIEENHTIKYVKVLQTYSLDLLF